MGLASNVRELVSRAALGVWLKSHPAAREIVEGMMLTGAVAHAEDLIANAGSYRVCSWVYSCVFAIASSGSTLPMRLYRKRGASFSEWEPIFDHPVLELVDQEPNEHEWETGQTFREALYSDMELNGNCYFYMNKDDAGRPVEVYRLTPTRVKIVPDSKRFVLGYLYEVNGRKVAFDREEVAHRKGYDPTNDFLGLSAIAAGRLAITGDVQSSLYNLAFFKNDAVPRGVLKIRTGEEDPGKPRRLELVTEWRKAYKGVGKSHKTAILPPGMEFQPIGISPKDMEFVMQQRMDRERIASIFRVPPVMIGIFEYANYANSHEQKLSFWHETMIPKIQAFDDMFTKAIARPYGKDLVLRTDLSAVWALVKDQRDAMEMDIKACQGGMSYPNERRALRGEKPLPWGEEYMVPLNLVPYSQYWGKGENPLAGGASTPGGNGGDDDGKGRIVSARQYDVRGRQLYDSPLLQKASYVAWSALLIPLMAQFARTWKRILDDQEAQVLRNLQASDLGKAGSWDIESILFDYEYWQDGTIRRCRPHLTHALNEAGLWTLAELDLGIEFNLADPWVQQAIEAKVFKFAHEVNAVTLDGLRTTLGEGVEAGEVHRELAQRVRDAFGGRKDNAGVVATTEVGSVSNAGRLAAQKQSNIVSGREWYAGGPNPRVHHLVAGAENGVVPLNQPFIVMGEELWYPGDPQGRAENVCGCKCSTFTTVRE